MKRQIFLFIIWFILFLAGLSIGIPMISTVDTAENLMGFIILTLVISISFTVKNK